MKSSSKILISIVLALTLWGGVGFDFEIKKVQAQTPAPTTTGTVQDCGSEPTPVDPNSSAYIAWRQCRANAANATAANQLETSYWKLGLKNAAAMISDKAVKAAFMVIGGIIQLMVIPVLGMLLKIATFCLDQATQIALDSTNISIFSESITKVWIIVRDVFNITFIFILLWSAIQTILGIAGGNTKKVIANVVIAAVLINFSLFITRIIIDAGNLLAVPMYNAAISTGGTATSTLSTIVADNLSLGALFQATNGASVYSSEFFIISALQLITILVALVTFGYVAMLMLVRNVVLIFLMAISPIGFMGSILPKISEYSKMWWENLYGQIMITPIFLLLFYLVTYVGKGLKTINLSQDASGVTDFGQYMKYILITILLIVAVKVTKKLSGVVGETVGKLGGMAVGAGIGLAVGGLALAGRTAVGRVAAKVAESDTLRNAASQKGLGGLAARMTLKGVDKTSKASFDIRNTKTMGGLMGQINKNTGLDIDIGKGGKGFVDRREEYAKKEAEFAKNNLSRNITEAEAVKEHQDIKAEKQSRLAEIRSQTRRLDDIVVDNTKSEKEREKARKKAERLTTLAEAEQSELNRILAMEERDEQGNLTQKSRESIKKERSTAFQEEYAQTSEKSAVNWIRGSRVAVAKKIRKDVIKGKSGAEQLQEAVEKAAKEMKEKENKTTEKPKAEAPKEEGEKA